MCLSLMIIDDLHVEGIAVFPAETDAVLVVDPHAVLPLPVSFQSFQAVGGRRCQITKFFRAIDLNQSSEGDRIDRLKTLDPVLVKDQLCIFVAKRSDQTSIILRYASN